MQPGVQLFGELGELDFGRRPGKRNGVTTEPGRVARPPVLDGGVRVRPCPVGGGGGWFRFVVAFVLRQFVRLRFLRLGAFAFPKLLLDPSHFP